jgi:hypothetical protein
MYGPAETADFFSKKSPIGEIYIYYFLKKKHAGVPVGVKTLIISRT